MVVSGAPFRSGREIANADYANFPLTAKGVESPCRLLEGNGLVRPVHLIDVDHIGLEAAERFLELPSEERLGGVAQDLAASPVEPDLGGNDRAFTPATFQRLADQLLGAPEAIDGRRVDEIDTVVEGGVNGADRVALLGAAP